MRDPRRVSSTLSKSRRSNAFTLIELVAVVAIIAFLIVGSYFFTLSYVSSTQTVSTNLTIDVLNKALAQYRTYGGPQSAYSLGGVNSTTKISNLITAFKNGLTFNGASIRFLPPSTVIQTSGITGTGSSSNYMFAPTGSALNVNSPTQAKIQVPTAINFGTVAAGNTPTQTLTITNTGNAILTVSSLTVPSGYTAGWTSGSIAPGATQNVTITYYALAGYSDYGDITITSNAVNAPTATVPVTGTGGTSVISLSGDMNFGPQQINSGATHTLTITNTGNMPFTLNSFSVNVSGAYFSNLSTGTVIPAGGFVNVSVVFDPQAVQSYNGTITIGSTATSGTNTIAVVGSGVQETISLSSSLGSPMAFGTVCINSTVTATLAIANNGGAPLTVSAISLPSGYTADWTSGTIAAGGVRNVTVSFSPTVNGTAYNGTITVTSNAASGTNTMSVSGTGGEPQFSISSSLGSPTMAFGYIAMNTTATGTLMIQNTGTTPMHVTSITYPAHFSGAWSGTIAVGATQNVTVTFAPVAETAYSGNLTVNISDPAYGGTNTFALSGNGEDITTGEVLYYSLDNSDISGASVSDLSGNGNTGTLKNSPTTGTPGAINQSILLNGSTQYIDVGAPSSLNLSSANAFTLSAWVYPTSAPTNAGLITEMYSPTNHTVQYEMGFDEDQNSTNSRLSVGFYDDSQSGWYIIRDSSNIPTNAWEYITSTWDGTTLSLYKNGSLVTSSTFSAHLATTYFDDVVIGRRHDNAGQVNFFPGYIDETRIYNRALNVGEIGALYNLSPGFVQLSGNMAFGTAFVNTTATATLTISNPGSTPITVTSISYPTGFSGTWSGTIAAHGSQNVTVTFAPTAVTTYSGTLTVNSSASSGINTMAISGSGSTMYQNLLLYYSMDNADVSGTNIYDLSGNSYNGTLVNSPTTGATGQVNQAVSFNGSSSYINSGNPSAFDLGSTTPNYTVTFWLNTSNISYSTAYGLLGKGGTNGSYQGWYVLSFPWTGSTYDIQFNQWDSSNVQHCVGIGPTTPVTGWHYFTFVRNGMTLTGYMDAAVIGTATFADNTTNSSGYNLYFGRDYDSYDNVALDEVRIYGRALSASEVGTLYGYTTAAPAYVGLSGNMAFGNVFVNNTATATLTISNPGSSALTVSSISYPTGFSGNWSSGTIAAGSSQNVTVTFAPTTTGSYSGNITVSSNAGAGTNTIAASGTGTTVSQGLRLYYTLDNTDISGTSVTDLSGNANTGTLNGSPTTGVTAHINQGVTYNGSSQYIEALTSSTLSFSGPVTMAAWVNMSAFPSSGGLGEVFTHEMDSGSNSGDYLDIWNNSGTVEVRAGSYNGSDHNTLWPISGWSTGSWHYLVGTYDGTYWNIYFDGVLKSSTANATGAISESTGVTMGAFKSPSYGLQYFLSGTEDDVRYYNRALGPYEVAALYASTTPGPSYVALSGNMAFGTVLDTLTSTATLTISNPGSTSMTVSSISYPSGYTGNWSSGTIAAGGSQNVTVTFAPTAVSTYNGTITVTSNAGAGTNTISVTGTGTDHISIPMTNNDFEVPNEGYGYIYYTGTTINGWTYNNNAGIAANSSAFGVTSAHNGNSDGTTSTRGQAAFVQTSGNGTGSSLSQSVSLPTTGCAVMGFSTEYRGGFGANPMQAQWDGTTLLSFTPTSSSSFQSMSVPTLGTSGSHTVKFLGTADSVNDHTSFIDSVSVTLYVGSYIGLSGNMAFGNVLNTTSSTATLTINNFGTNPMTVSSISYPSGYSGNWSSGTIAAGSSQNVTVTFTPPSTGTYNGNITVTSNAQNGSGTIAVTGGGVSSYTRIIGISGSMAFGSVQVGQSSTLSMGITNSGNSTMTVSGITYPSGQYSGDWSSGTIASGATQYVNVTFAPGSTGTDNGTITVSSNATSGTNTVAATADGVNIAYFIAVATQSSDAAYSMDGYDWNSTSLPVSDNWYSGTVLNGTYVVVAYNSSNVAYSYDGVNWNVSSMPEYDVWDNVTSGYSYDSGQNTFVAVAFGSQNAAYSYDGVNWYRTLLPESDNWSVVMYGNGMFVAVAYSSQNTAYSYDGVNWYPGQAMPYYDNWIAGAYNQNYGNFSVAAQGSSNAAYSNDGQTWNPTSMASNDYWQNMAYNPNSGYTTAVANQSTEDNNYSYDGQNWNYNNFPFYGDWNDIAYSNNLGMMVAIADSQNEALYSYDGFSWNIMDLPSYDNWWVTVGQ